MTDEMFKQNTCTFITERKFPSFYTTAITHAGLSVTCLGHVTIYTAVLHTIFSIQLCRTFLINSKNRYWIPLYLF